MERLRERGIEVIALADHHTAEWLDVMREAGNRAGVAVFPGVEVTTSSGADGVHLVIIGDRDATIEDIEDLLIRVCGFGGPDHPRFHPLENTPAPAPRQLTEILDGLDDRWFALAPHALGQNGIASGKSLQTTLRWNALHHPRLAALDPGMASEGEPASGKKVPHNQLFRNRSLDGYPRLRDLAYIHTSDGYSLDAIGTRYSWIRMAEPSLEALRQASLDHEARIIGYADEGLPANYDPNQIQLEDATGCRPGWWKKLKGLDEALRIRLASLLADDVATMYFLRTGGDPADPGSWQEVTNGSAGQRSAAMLSFVLNYGTEPLVLDQPEDDLDTALITKLVVPQIRRSRWNRQVIIVTHHANIPVNGDAEQVIVLTNDGRNIQVKNTPDPGDPAREVLHAGPIEVGVVREDIQEILEGGKEAFQARERRYNNDLNPLHEAKRELLSRGGADR